MHIPSDEYLATCDNTISKKEYCLRTDNHGFIIERSFDNTITDVIIYLGDSVVENLYVDEGMRAARVAARFLHNANRICEVLNGGVTGATSLELVNVIINKCLPLKPKAIVVTSGAIDMMALLSRYDYWSQIVGQGTISATRRSFNPHYFVDRDSAIRLSSAVCEAENIPLVLTTWGFTERMLNCFGLRSVSHISHNWLGAAFEINQTTRQLANSTGARLIDLAAEMNNREQYFYDGLHPNAAGCELIGRKIGAAIEEILQET